MGRLIPEGGLDLAAFFDLATPLAEAISAAHDKSVIHRDLKPSTVMVDGDGRVKVLDFGLAKLQQAEEVSESTELPTEALTGVGTIVGTVPYMSPEQVEGLRVDHRTDIFSLGVLLYEMVTGERPFQGTSQPSLMSSILRDVPSSVVEIRDDLPRHLGRVISRCLEKDRRDRYQTARDVFNELKALKRETFGESVASAPPRNVPVRRHSTPSTSSRFRTGLDRAIAVAPFRAPASDAALAALAEGLSEDITSGLARFPYLTIIDGPQHGVGEDSGATAAGRGVRYILRGGLRSAGSELRLSVQLVEVETGAHVWSETYDRRLDGASLFELQDSLADRIVATVGDYAGVLARLVAAELRAVPDHEMTVDDWVMRAVCFQQVIHPPEEHAAIRDGLEAAIRQEPDNAEVHAWLANVYRTEYFFDFNLREGPIERALQAAQRAVDLDPTSQAGWDALASAHFLLGDVAAFEAAAARALELNRRNSYTAAVMGLLFGISGRWERGARLGLEACALNPNHPEWYPFVNFYCHYDKQRYEEALAVLKGINFPRMPYSYINLAAVCGQLGRLEEARTAIARLRRDFDYDLERVRREYAKWGHTKSFLDHLADGLRKAGLDDDVSSPQSSVVQPPSQPEAVRSQTVGGIDPKSIAVLPFVNMSADRENEFFSDGVTEEILASLSKITGLRVISRTSAMTYKGTSKSIREIAAELEVGTVLEGSVRRAGNRVRVTAQLIEAATDKHLWSESYDRDLEDIFAVQGDVALQIAQALRTELGSDVIEQIRRRPTENVEAYDLYLKGRQGVRTLQAPEVLRGIEQLEEAIELDPDFSAAHGQLAISHVFSAHWGAARGRDDLVQARRAAERALTLDPDNVLARVARAGVLSLLDLDWEGAVAELKKAVELDPNEIEAHFWYGVTLFLMGRFDASAAAHEVALALDPRSPNVISQLGLSLYFAGDRERGKRLLREGIEQHPVFFDLPNFLAMALKREGRFEEAARWFARTSELTGHHPVFEALRASTLRLAGSDGEAERILGRLRDSEDDPRIDSIARTIVAVAERDIESAVGHFNAAADQRLPLVFWFRPGLLDLEFSPDHPGVEALWRRLWPDDPTSADREKTSDADGKSIAVLPFIDMSPGRDHEWFCEGVAEEILNALAGLPDLRVATRTSAFRFKDPARDLAAIGARLGVSTLLEGSVRTAGTRLRVTAQLVSAAEGTQLWSERFDREMADVFEVQDEIAARVVEALEISMLGSAEVGGSDRHSPDIEAYHLYLKGRHARYSRLDLKTALECFEGAVRRDSSYSLARIGLAETLVVLSMYGFVPPNEGMTRARDELRQAGDATRESAEA
ncbi:MAG TPA: tetratricopeptide repeat protein, partial [Chondromyces sp.]|nr:tetratricopeptide repeat protein [Chondromyces sp.]